MVPHLLCRCWMPFLTPVVCRGSAGNLAASVAGAVLHVGLVSGFRRSRATWLSTRSTLQAMLFSFMISNIISDVQHRIK